MNINNSPDSNSQTPLLLPEGNRTERNPNNSNGIKAHPTPDRRMPSSQKRASDPSQTALNIRKVRQDNASKISTPPTNKSECLQEIQDLLALSPDDIADTVVTLNRMISDAKPSEKQELENALSLMRYIVDLNKQDLGLNFNLGICSGLPPLRDSTTSLDQQTLPVLQELHHFLTLALSPNQTFQKLGKLDTYYREKRLQAIKGFSKDIQRNNKKLLTFYKNIPQKINNLSLSAHNYNQGFPKNLQEAKDQKSLLLGILDAGSASPACLHALKLKKPIMHIVSQLSSMDLDQINKATPPSPNARFFNQTPATPEEQNKLVWQEALALAQLIVSNRTTDDVIAYRKQSMFSNTLQKTYQASKQTYQTLKHSIRRIRHLITGEDTVPTHRSSHSTASQKPLVDIPRSSTHIIHPESYMSSPNKPAVPDTVTQLNEDLQGVQFDTYPQPEIQPQQSEIPPQQPKIPPHAFIDPVPLQPTRIYKVITDNPVTKADTNPELHKQERDELKSNLIKAVQLAQTLETTSDKNDAILNPSLVHFHPFQALDVSKLSLSELFSLLKTDTKGITEKNLKQILEHITTDLRIKHDLLILRRDYLLGKYTEETYQAAYAALEVTSNHNRTKASVIRIPTN